ncbi:sulfite exporter TauE/SafE family protein [Bradyrhizobium erythrophlei]|uniref:sulfite exporter TauE/SafE family protein n=1 Tax=Bradyrhizobium erythrophlei TaxID=1437360 RepID=UPI0035EC1870
MFSLLFAIISLLYTTVGQAGGTAFLALMAFAALPPTQMRPTALALNIVVATYSTWVFNRNKVIDWTMLRPLVLSSMPTALAGGLIVLGEHIYRTLTGVVLLLAGAAMILRRGHAADRNRETPLWGAVSVGAAIGLVSGLTGVGGGVFLAPTLIAMNWASPKQTAAVSAPFILANSTVGLVGVLFTGQFPSLHLGLYAIAALGGAIAGTAIGLKWLGQTAISFILAAILLAAGVQLILG